MNATCAFGPSTRSPSTKASPSLGAESPEPMLSKVDLPQPLGPISDTTSPSRTAMLTPCTAVRLRPLALREAHRDVAVFEADHVRHRKLSTASIRGASRSLPRLAVWLASCIFRTMIVEYSGKREAADSLDPAQRRFAEGRATMRHDRLSRRQVVTAGAALGAGLLPRRRVPRAGAREGHLSVSRAAGAAGVRADSAGARQGLLQGSRPRRRVRGRPRRRRRGQAGRRRQRAARRHRRRRPDHGARQRRAGEDRRVFGGKGFMQLVVREDSGINKPADLKGKTITVMSYQDTTFYALLGLMASAGLTQNDVNVQRSARPASGSSSPKASRSAWPACRTGSRRSGAPA